MVSFSGGALLLAFVITLLEMTEVVALVFALRGDDDSIRHGILGATAGAGVVGALGLVSGAEIAALPERWLLLGASITLFAFGGFIFRGTRRAYRRAWNPSSSAPASKGGEKAVQFGGGFTVGAVETTEAVIVLVALAAAGQGPSALVGAIAAVVSLLIAAAILHQHIRKVKIPLLRLGATSLLFAFATFYLGEALNVNWPLGDLILVPLFVVAILIVRPVIGALEGGPLLRLNPNR
jgi:Ca2+/H+ antiporter, TMEM165/GDT1 family